MARRSRSRSSTRLRFGLAAAALIILTGLVVSGLVSSARSNKVYVEVMNHSVAAQANSISIPQQDNGSALTSLMGELTLLTRAQITRAFDDLVYRTQLVVDASSIMPGDGASHHAGQRFAQIQAERALGVAKIRAAVDGLMGLQPFTVVGAPASAQLVLAPLTQAEASALAAAGGALIQRADGEMLALKVALARGPGHVHLRNTAFVVDPSIFSVAAMDTLFRNLMTTPHLTPVISLSLVGATLIPSPLPTTSTSGVVNEPPTNSLGVTAVIANTGNAVARDTVVVMTVTSPSSFASSSSRAIGSVDAGGSLALRSPSVSVTPGSTVTVHISIHAPGSGVALTRTYRVAIAQATPAPPPSAG